MASIRQRLLEIAEELGESRPRNRYFEKLLDLSSGRVSQLLDPQSLSKIGPATMSKLAELGYNPDWVQTGNGPRRLTGAVPAQQRAQSTDQAIDALQVVRDKAPKRAAQIEQMIFESLRAIQLLEGDMKPAESATEQESQRPFNQAA